MEPKMSHSMMLPMLYGLLAGWMGVGSLTAFVLYYMQKSDIVVMAAALSALLLMALLPALRRAAWVYTNVRKYHNAEYYYEMGNGTEMAKAVERFENKVRKAVGAWLKRKFVKNSFGVLPVGYVLVVLSGGGWLESLVFMAVVMSSVVLAVFVGMIVMLLSARKLCYDKFGNLKNH